MLCDAIIKIIFPHLTKNTPFFRLLLLLFHLICLLYDFECKHSEFSRIFLLSIKSTPTETFDKLQFNKSNNKKVSYFERPPRLQPIPISWMLKCSFALCCMEFHLYSKDIISIAWNLILFLNFSYEKQKYKVN